MVIMGMQLLLWFLVDRQCWSRWHDALKPRIDHKAPRVGRWTNDEDGKLKGAVEKYGGQNWGAIAALVPGRVRRQCRNRWAHLGPRC